MSEIRKEFWKISIFMNIENDGVTIKRGFYGKDLAKYKLERAREQLCRTFCENEKLKVANI